MREAREGHPSRDEALEREQEGSILFHLGLFLGLIPGLSTFVAVMAYFRFGSLASRWGRRLVALAVLDGFTLVAAILTPVLALSALGGLDASNLEATLEAASAPAEAPAAAAPAAIDAAGCTEAAASLRSAGELLVHPAFLVTLGVLVLLLTSLFVWGRRRGLAVREQAKVMIPFLLVLFGAPMVGSLATTAACSLFVDWDVRLETIDIFVSELLLVGSALALLYANRRLAPFLQDEGPRLGYFRALGQSIAYVFAWMPRALMLAAPLAALVLSEGALEDAPIAALVTGASRTPLDAALTFAAAAILAPIAEESLFRGVLAPHLGRLTDGFSAILLTAAIFGALHIGGHGPLFIGPMFLGAILGWSRLRTGNLAASITLHMLLNGTAMTLALTMGLG